MAYWTAWKCWLKTFCLFHSCQNRHFSSFSCSVCNIAGLSHLQMYFSLSINYWILTNRTNICRDWWRIKMKSLEAMTLTFEKLITLYSFLDSFLVLNITLYPWHHMSPCIHFHPSILLQQNSKQDMNAKLLYNSQWGHSLSFTLLNTWRTVLTAVWL